MYSDAHLKKVLNKALSHGGDFAEIFLEKSKSNAIFLDDNRIEKVKSDYDQGVAIRVIAGEQTAYGYTNDLSEEKLLETAQAVSESLALGKNDIEINLSSLAPSRVQNILNQPEKIKMDQKVKFLNTANDTARQYDSRIKQVTARYGDTTQEVFIANSEGFKVSDTRTRIRMYVECVAKDQKIIQTGMEAPGAHAGLEFFEMNRAENIAATAARRAILNLSARPAPAGTFMVVLAGEAGGTLVHEACGHALEADFIYKKTSIFTNQLNKQVVSPLVTVVDDGTLPGYFGTLGYDDEGTRTNKNILIENGVIKKFMNDRLSAKILNVPATGNGRRESYRNKPVPRMTNTYIAAGSSRPEDIIASVQDGILIKKMGGGQVDITNGDFVFEVTEGYLIKNGKVTDPIRGATLVGNGPQTLGLVDMVGNDLSFIPGICGKYDSAPFTDCFPTLRIKELVVGGIA